MYNINLLATANHLKEITSIFTRFTVIHVFRLLNEEAVSLSKEGLLLAPGELHSLETDGDTSTEAKSSI